MACSPPNEDQSTRADQLLPESKHGILRLATKDIDSGLVCAWLQSAREQFLWLGREVTFPLAATTLDAEAECAAVRAHLFEPRSPAPVGYGELHLVDAESRWVRLVRLVTAPNARREGFGRFLTASLASFARRELGARRVDLVVLAENEAALRLYRGLGFEQDGLLRRAKVLSGELHDIAIMSVPDDWSDTP